MAISQITDHAAQAIARLAQQYRGTDVESLVSAFANRAQDADDALFAVLSLSLDTAVGVRLDTLGKLVGEPRKSRTDDVYRVWIKGRLLANRSSGTVENLLAVLRPLIAPAQPRVDQSFPAAVFISADGDSIDGVLAGDIAEILRAALAAGVRALVQWSETTDPASFSFDGGTGAGFGDATDGSIGGALAGIVER